MGPARSLPLQRHVALLLLLRMSTSAMASIFLDLVSCTEVTANEGVVLGKGRTKVVSVSSLRGNRVVVKRMRNRQNPDMRAYFDLFREATLLREVNLCHRESSVQVYGICRTEHMLSDFAVIEHVETLQRPDPAVTAETNLLGHPESTTRQADVKWCDEYDNTAFGALTKNLSLTKAKLHTVFHQLATLPSGAIALHDLSWGQFGLLPSGALAVIDLGCVRFGGLADDVMDRARHLTDRLVDMARGVRAKTEAMCAARAMDVNLTALAKTSSRARRALHGDGIMTGDNTSDAASHPNWHPFGANNCIGWSGNTILACRHGTRQRKPRCPAG